MWFNQHPTWLVRAPTKGWSIRPSATGHRPEVGPPGEEGTDSKPVDLRYRRFFLARRGDVRRDGVARGIDRRRRGGIAFVAAALINQFAVAIRVDRPVAAAELFGAKRRRGFGHRF